MPDPYDLYVGEMPFDLTPQEAAEELARKQAEWTKAIAETERRSNECVNALAGYNPAALAALVEAAEGVVKHFDGTLRDKDWPETERVLRTALTAIRAGEAS